MSKAKTSISSSGQKSSVSAKIKNESVVLNTQLEKLDKSLQKSFRAEFIESISYLIRVENQSEADFQIFFEKEKIDWSKLEYFFAQLKKIIKHKAQLLELVNRMQVHSCKNKHITREFTNSPSPSNSLNIPPAALITLVNEYDKFDGDSASNNDYFVLTNVLVRLFFKLAKLSYLSNDSSNHLKIETMKIFELKLILLSSIADLSYYEEIRNHVNKKYIQIIFYL
jgi:hypothetical protein